MLRFFGFFQYRDVFVIRLSAKGLDVILVGLENFKYG